MKVQNISNRQLTVTLDSESRLLAAGDVGIFPDTDTARLEFQAFAAKGYIALYGSADLDEDGGAAVYSALLLAVGQPQNTGTVTVHGVVFEFENDGSVTDGNVAVTIGASTSVTMSDAPTTHTATWPAVVARFHKRAAVIG